MDLQKYNGNIHPDEWMDDLQRYLGYNNNSEDVDYLNLNFVNFAKSLVDSTISLPTGIDSFAELRNALKKDISFTVFKNTNKRKLQSLKYIPESKGGDSSKFISNFRKLCYNAEITADIEEQKKYLYKSLPMNHLDYISNEFYEKMKNVNSVNELIKEFEDFIADGSHLITDESIVALKHTSTGKYLSSARNLNYSTGTQSVFVRSLDPGPNSLWKIKLDKEFFTYTDAYVTLQHIKSGMFLGIQYDGWFNYGSSPSTNHTKVSCLVKENEGEYLHNELNWKFNYSKLENHRRYLKSNDTINFSIKKSGVHEFLRSHDIQFTIGNDAFQEVCCHNERLGGNDEWCIELIEQA